MKLQRIHNAKKNLFYGIIAQIISILMPFVMRTMLLYSLGMEYMGLNGLFGSILQVLNLAELGVGSAMVFSMYKPIAEDDIQTLRALMRLYRLYYRIIGCVVGALGLSLIPFLHLLTHKEMPIGVNIYVIYLLYLFSSVFTYWLFSYKNCLLQAYQLEYVRSKIEIIMNIFKYILQLLALLFMHNFYLYVVCIFFTQITNNIITSVIVDRMFPGLYPYGKLCRKDISEINGRIRDIFIQKIGNVINSNYGILILSSFFGLGSLVKYQNYLYVISLPIAVSGVIMRSVIAGIGNSLLTENTKKNMHDFRILLTMHGLLSTICCSGLVVLYRHFIYIWLGEEFIYPTRVSLLFIIWMYLTLNDRVLNCYKEGAGIWNKDRFRLICTAVAGVLFSLWLMKPLGECGILIGCILSYVFICLPWLLYNIFSTVFPCGLCSFFRIVFKNILITFFSCCICFICCCSLPSEGILWFSIKGLIALTVSCLLLHICYHSTEEYIVVLSLIKGLLRRKMNINTRL